MADAYGGSGGMVGYANDYYSPENIKDRDERDRSAYRGEAWGGAMSGAGQGAQMGAQVAGPWGALFGGLFGAAGGGLKGMIQGDAKEKERRRKEKAWEEAKKQLAKDRYMARVATHKMLQNAYSPANAWLQKNYGSDAGMDLNKTPWGTVDPNAPPPQDMSKYGGVRNKSAHAPTPSPGSAEGSKQYPNSEPPANKSSRKKER